MMKHDVVSSKPLAIAPHKEPAARKSLWKSRSSSEAPTPKSPITKAFDFLPWSRSKKAATTTTTDRTKGKADLSPTSPPPADKADALTYQRTILRNGGELIRDILGDRLGRDERSLKKTNGRRSRQVTTRNKSLDINELINCVERELNGSGADAADAKHQRFLDDTFIENIMRAKESYEGELAAQDYQNYNDTEDEIFYHQQQELAQLCKHSEPLRCGQTGNPTSGLSSTSASPKHILFNDENIVYLIKKEQPVNKSLKNCDKERKSQSDNILKARLKFKKLSAHEGGTDYSSASMALNNTRLSQQDKAPAARKSILQRQNTTPDDSKRHHAAISPDVLPRRSPSAGRYQSASQHQHRPHSAANFSPHYQRRKSLTEGIQYDYPPAAALYETANSSTSSMGSGASGASGGGGVGGILHDRPKSEKPRKKLSFREPVVAGQRERFRRISAEAVSATGNGAAMQPPNGMGGGVGGSGKHFSCDNLGSSCKMTAPALEMAGGVIMQGEELMQSQAMRIVRTVGQAFEVCHKFNIHKNSVDHTEDRSDISSSELLDVETRSDHQLSDDDGHNKKAVTPELNVPQRPTHLELIPQANLSKSGSILTNEDKSPTSPSSPSREINKLKDQLEQQAMQTRQALAQLMLVREQLISETNARIEAQARTQQLLQQNRELLEHLASLGAYTEQQTPGLTTANIGMAPQNHLQMLLQATAGNANNNLATINQQINNLGSINQQLTSLSHQLSGLNQQTQNLQNFQQQQQQQQQQQTPTSAGPNALTPTPTPSLHQSQLHLNCSASNNGNGSAANSNALSSSPFPSMNQLANITTQLQQQINSASSVQQDSLSKDLFQVNQDLLNRLQALNLGAGGAAGNLALANGGGTPSPHSSFFFVNPMSCSPSNNNNNASSNYNFLSTPTPSSMGNLTPSPLGTLNRNSYSNSPLNEEMRLSLDKNLNTLDEHLMKPLAQLTQSVSNGNISAAGGSRDNSRSSSTVEAPLGSAMGRSSSNLHNNNNNSSSDMSPSGSHSPRYNTVMLKVTDEAGNVTNQRKLSATPSFIQRSTSEKVPNRSQIMSQVQRTAWARHTTK